MCGFQDKRSCITTPRNFVSQTLCNAWLFRIIFECLVLCFQRGVWKIISLVLVMFNDNLLAISHLLTFSN